MTNTKVYQGFHDDKRVDEHEHCSRLHKVTNFLLTNSCVIKLSLKKANEVKCMLQYECKLADTHQ